MLELKDIELLKSILATKEDIEGLENRVLNYVASKHDLNEARSEVRELTDLARTAIDNNDQWAKPMDDLRLESAAMSGQLTDHETRIVNLEGRIA